MSNPRHLRGQGEIHRFGQPAGVGRRLLSERHDFVWMFEDRGLTYHFDDSPAKIIMA
ncbi:MAG: hypothetical protein VB858_08640 [Planctomycetaceae bacterium]